MLILLLMGITAGLVLMSFPDSAQNHLQQQRERLQAQLDYALDRSMQDGLLIGIQVRSDGWTFKVLQRVTAESFPASVGGMFGKGMSGKLGNRGVLPWRANFRMMCVLICSISEVCS
ncbi:EtpH, partial [Escherichia coli O103:H25 str. CVM9340]